MAVQVAAELTPDVSSVPPTVSVVVSTRNHATMLGDTVRAVMAQDLDDPIEMIVCDDASTDATPELMRQLLAEASRPLTSLRLAHNVGPATGRNIGVTYARGRFIAFTDSDCVPAPGWLRAALRPFAASDVGIVQGRTISEQDRVPLFEHHISNTRLEATFPTANVVYRRTALNGHRFDPACWSRRATWEDSDLAWRVQGAGWRAVYADDAVVAHKVIRLGAVRWVLWATRFAKMPAISARYPGFRRYLFLGVWIRPLHLWFELALLGVLAAPWQPLAILLALPYAVAFGKSRGLRGRFPPAKLAAYIARDAVAFASLVAGSLRYRSVVL